MEALSLKEAGHEPAHVRASSEGAVSSQLADLDHQILEIVSGLRVITQTQLERLLEEVPGRTVRYRTRHLHQLRLLGRTRPYRDRGSAPHHLWPTSRADAIVRAQPPPRRGERRPPNPLFLAHTAAVSELYVVLRTGGPEAGLTLSEFHREGDARETFTDADGRDRAIAPDARIALRDDDGRILLAYVELDLGTMPHARLRAKLGGYLSHAQQQPPSPVGPFAPTLLFITTGAPRAETFLRSARRLRASRDWDGDIGLQIAVCARARQLDGVLTERCWRDTRVDDAPLTLGELLDQQGHEADVTASGSGRSS